ncbi:MAG: twin-arginine translocation signal domain-containing protein [Verrucomicrobiota bacterium]
MNPTDQSPDPVSPTNEITRRNFMKKSALTVGAATILGKGMAVATGTSKCPRADHTSNCLWIKKVKVVLSGVEAPAQGSNTAQSSGRIFTGKLKYLVGHTISGGTSEYWTDEFDVTCGGFLFGNKHLVQGPNCDTAPPASLNYMLGTTPSPTLAGFSFIPQPPHRTDILIHGHARPNGSSGCIAFTEDEASAWNTFSYLVKENAKPCKQNPPNPIPLTLEYNGVTPPNYVWKAGHEPNGNPCDGPNCK